MLSVVLLAAAISSAILQMPRADVRVEIAATNEQRERGLMYRASVPAHTGMLFVFERDQHVDFWMKNTLVPLDMVFVSGRGIVRSIAARVPATTPATPDERIPRRGGQAKYVIELPAGEAARDGVTVGSVIGGVAAFK